VTRPANDARLDLLDLVARYFIAVDARDYPGVAATFAPDGRLGDTVGREAIVAHLRDEHAAMGPTVHSGHLPAFTVTGPADATGIVPAHCETVRDGVGVVAAMQYHDRYIRGPDGWWIAERRVLFHYVCPWSEIGTSLTAALRKRWPGRPPEAASLP
jgi:hypothetical protein